MAGDLHGHVAGAPGIGELIALINVSVVAAIIVVAGGKGIKGFLKNRSGEVSKGLVDAKKDLEETLKQIESARAQIADIDNLKKTMIAQVVEEGEKLSKQILDEARSTADRILADAKLAASNEVSSASQTLKKHLVEQSVASALDQVKSGNADLKTKLHNNLVDRFVEDLARTSPSNGNGHGRYTNGH